MLKKFGIYICLLGFVFQAIVFNCILSGSIFLAKIDEDGYQHRFTFSQEAFEKLNWRSQNEFSVGKYLVDIKEKKQKKNTITVLCRIDLKEKDFIEKLCSFFKRTKNKKFAFFALQAAFTEQYQLKKPIEERSVQRKDFLFSLLLVPSQKTAPPPRA